MDKYRGRMVQGDYIMGNIFHKGESSNQSGIDTLFNKIDIGIHLLGHKYLILQAMSSSILVVIQFSKT